MDSEFLPYRNLHADHTLAHPDLGACFVGEGRYLVAEMLKAHAAGILCVRSVLCTPAAGEGLGELPEGVRRLELEKAELQTLAGFPFNRGVMALAPIPEPPDPSRLAKLNRLLVLPRLDNAENLGALLRTAAALGMEGVLVGQGPSPFVTRALRVAMGATWRLPLWHQEDLLPLLDLWRATGGEVVGAALSAKAISSRTWLPVPRTALLLGAEDRGLDAPWIAACDRLVQIPMASGMDSLNVAAAGAILMERMVQAE
jgi:tRNA G18 (ribose-2'-O)-methylase SpoU